MNQGNCIPPVTAGYPPVTGQEAQAGGADLLVDHHHLNALAVAGGEVGPRHALLHAPPLVRLLLAAVHPLQAERQRPEEAQCLVVVRPLGVLWGERQRG